MQSNREEFVSEIYVNGEQANDAMEKLRGEVDKTAKAYEKLLNTKDADPVKTEKARKAWESATQSLERARKGTEAYDTAMKNLSGKSMENLLRMQRQIKKELDKTKPNTAEWNELAKAYQNVSNRIKSLGDAQRGIVVEGNKSTTAFGRFFNKVNDFYGGITIYAKAAKAGLQAIIGVTRQVINASDTLGDKWNNGMAAMKTTTEAFFMALSTGDWTAFNDGLAEALKKARELAELKDVLGDFNISGGVMQSEYLTGFNKARTTATDTEADPTARLEALKDMQSNLEAYNNFVQREGETTLKALMKSFDAWKGIVFDSEEEFHSFFIRLFEYTTTGYDEEVNELLRLESEVDKWAVIVGNAAQTGGKNIERLNENLLAAQAAYDAALAAASDETKALAKAVELPDDKKQELARLFQSWKQGVDTVEQRTIQMNRTRDRVMKQLGGNIDVMMTTIDEWVAKEKEGALARYEANATSMEATQAAFVVYQDEMARIEAEGEAKREAARAKAEEERRKADEKARQERQAAADKAYQNAQNKTAKAESAQLTILKSLYANGLMDKATYEAQKAVVEEDFLKQRLAVAEKYGRDTDQYMNQLLDRQIARMEKAKAMLKEEADEMARYYEGLRTEDEGRYGASTGSAANGSIADQEAYGAFQEKIWAKANEIKQSLVEDSARTEYETQMKWIEKLHKDGLLSDEEFEKAKLDQKLGFAAKIAQEVNRYAEMASNFSNALKEAETAQLEAEYQKQLTAAGDNAEERERIEAEYEQKKLDMQKKYADVDMVINIAKAIASGALAAVEAFAAAGGNPVLGGIFAALIAATTAAEVATIVAQRNAIKNTSIGGGGSSSAPKTGERKMTGYSEGGFTPKAASDSTAVGVVHANEYVAPAWMVRQNPVTFANLERYRKAGSHGRSGSMSRGFADGGFTPGKGGGPSATMPEQIDIEAAVEAAIRRVMADGAIRAYVVRKDIEELDAQTLKFKKLGSR